MEMAASPRNCVCSFPALRDVTQVSGPDHHFFDSLIIAAALSAGCDRLYSEDLQHGQLIEGLTIVNPFLEPASTS
jgi:predicted nucleic acid-binding protein